jgi:hypothetical protein
MYAWHFTEMPYPHLPPLDTLSTIGVGKDLIDAIAQGQAAPEAGK